ncbi:MAG: hypothetical protein HRF49_06585 [bacterium]|jgi:hypothetical protein
MNDLFYLADLLEQRHIIEKSISDIIRGPAYKVNVAEYLAIRVFDIQAAGRGHPGGMEGWFASGPLSGRSVKVKAFARNEYYLDIPAAHAPEYYLVFIHGGALLVSTLYLINIGNLLKDLQKRGALIGGATNLPRSFWDDSELFPRQISRELILSPEQHHMLSIFA